MKLEICTCNGKEQEVFILDDQEIAFFNNNLTDFSDWFNEMLENEMSISESVESFSTMDKLSEENRKLRERINKLEKK